MKNSSLMLWEFLEEQVHNFVPTALLIVVESEGSSPGRVGFKMAVNDKKEMSGSIGGGIMEVKIVEKVYKALKFSKLKTHLIRQQHNKDSPVNQSGMICSGFQTILILPLMPEYLTAITTIKDSLIKNNIVSLFIQYSKNETKLKAINEAQQLTSFTQYSQESYLFNEVIGQKETVVIIGGGHCSLALSELLNWLDFRVKIIETRKHINTLTSNIFAHDVNIVDTYEDIIPLIPDQNSYLVVMTIGYRQDDIVLRQLLGVGYRYIGVLGSKKKIETLISSLSNDFSDDVLAEINAPIGLDISSKTTREIAVSIAGEIIGLRNKKN